MVGKGIVSRSLFTLFFLIPLVVVFEIPIFMAGAGLGAYVVFSRNLPEIPELASYQPRTVSTFYADDGTVIGSFYKERRFVVDLAQIPPHVINAFLASEDARFYEHSGVDWTGLVRAAISNIRAGRIVQGGSTITMQVARNFFLTRERSFSRKFKEMILARQLEKVWGKQKILYVYLNEIYLGEHSYGVEAAARCYFDKPVEHLTVAEAALIAGLVAAPASFNPFKNEGIARRKQATVLGRMLRAKFISEEEYQRAKAEPLHIKRGQTSPFDLVPDFTEAVRRYIVNKYGKDKLYNQGLKVFTTCRIDYQRKALEAVEKGLAEVKSRQKHLAILRTVPQDQISDLIQRRRTPELKEGKIYQGVVVKVVKRKNKEMDLQVALSKRLRGIVRVNEPKPVYRVGNVLALRFSGFVDETPLFVPDNNPKLQGALVAIENRTGYVRALVGGVSGEHFQFNRATQGRRQPGSAFKPIIYSVALEDKSYSPATIIVDEQIEVELDKEDEVWEPRNAGGTFLGPLSFRRALELSRNICTIKILMDVGFDPVIEMARAMGITTPLGRNLSLSLGTSEVSLFELTSAYTVFPNSGVHVEPVLVKRIEDRYGNVLEDNTQIPLLDNSEIPRPVPREEFRNVPIANTGSQDYQAAEDDPVIDEESVGPEGAQYNGGTKEKNSQKLAPGKEGPGGDSRRVRAAMSPQTAYIMTSLLQGGVREGTGARMARYVKRKDLAGKTGTTNNAEDTWFIGFNPEFTAGVWVGFDEKRPLGSREEGARAALPVWGYFMKEVLANKPEKEFPVPPDITFQDMLTFTGSPSQGFSPKLVREPLYTPFVGKTLVLCPLDSPETLAAYRVPLPGLPAGQSPYGYQQTGQPQPSPYPLQPDSTPPVHPLDGRNLFPDQAAPQGEVSPRQNIAPPQPAGVSNLDPAVQGGYASDVEAPVRPSMGNLQPSGPGSDQPRQQNLNPRDDPRSYQQPNPNPYSYQAPIPLRPSMTGR
jgi:penicillin-binding protein 1A